MVQTGTWAVKVGLAQMLKGGVIMDVVTPEQAIIAQEAGACSVMALERVPSDIRKDGGVARMSDPEMIRGIIAAVSIPVMRRPASATLLKPMSSRRSASITSTSPKCSRPPTRRTTLTSTPSPCPSFAAAATSVRRSVASAKAPR